MKPPPPSRPAGLLSRSGKTRTSSRRFPPQMGALPSLPPAATSHLSSARPAPPPRPGLLRPSSGPPRVAKPAGGWSLSLLPRSVAASRSFPCPLCLRRHGRPFCTEFVWTDAVRRRPHLRATLRRYIAGPAAGLPRLALGRPRRPSALVACPSVPPGLPGRPPLCSSPPEAPHPHALAPATRRPLHSPRQNDTPRPPPLPSPPCLFPPALLRQPPPPPAPPPPVPPRPPPRPSPRVPPSP
ncbi:unnamed protein product [Arctia plantaginis]|uniref:Uncharacterized protein n=1 Tax=Arctia plantaginis TaxID=874455 RepID=A0A8S0YW78_ARCPL|nr:unnamed protein product [Arctia plantaginis]